MTLLLMIRHAPTDWNEVGRLQGRTDLPLSARGRQLAASWRLPDGFRTFHWVASPLDRCRETAQILAGRKVATDPRLVEMSWGEWEGRTIGCLRRNLGRAMLENEARGLDFLPPGGESPRMVQGRLLSFFAECAASARPHIAVTHRGVIRATFALATGWDMKGKPPTRIDRQGAHLFRLDRSGAPTAKRLNLSFHSPPHENPA